MKSALLLVQLLLYVGAVPASTIYVTDVAGDLATVDPSSGRTNLVGTFPVPMSDLAYDEANKVMYAASADTVSRLFRIDPLNPANATPVLTLPSYVNSLSFATGSSLVAAGGDSLFLINLDSNSTAVSKIPSSLGPAAG